VKHTLAAATSSAPVRAVPPELLRDIAIKNLTLPPLLDWNPKRIGNQGTLVNLHTWFWLDNPPSAWTSARLPSARTGDLRPMSPVQTTTGS
jgi:hypothetical protein